MRHLCKLGSIKTDAKELVKSRPNVAERVIILKLMRKELVCFYLSHHTGRRWTVVNNVMTLPVQ